MTFDVYVLEFEVQEPQRIKDLHFHVDVRSEVVTGGKVLEGRQHVPDA
jgi:hypothetical protein